MKNQKTIVRILALVMAALLALSLIVSVIPVRSHADCRADAEIRNTVSVLADPSAELQ